MLKINLINQYDDFTRLYKKTIRTVMKAGYLALGLNKPAIINVILVTNAEIHRLNNQYRHIDKPTDVISFENNDGMGELGDIFISIDKAKEQAAEYGHSFERELGFLACHGFLHCNGYDHQNGMDEKAMFALQDEILEKIHLTR
jgi:probable rRNA maturation factor